MRAREGGHSLSRSAKFIGKGKVKNEVFANEKEIKIVSLTLFSVTLCILTHGHDAFLVYSSVF
jgi:hypothetical protein